MSLYEMRNTVAGRVAGTLAAFALVLSLSFGGALNAQAQTEQELRDQIAQLTALIAQLQAQVGGSTSTPSTGDFNYTFTRNLTIGATGQDVLMLQKYLNRIAATQVAAVGQAGGPGTETSYYGPATGAAVKRYQELHRAEILAPLGLTAGTVNFGSSTRAFMNAEIAAGGSTTPGTPGTPGTGTGDLKGGEGLIEVFNVSSATVTVDTNEVAEVYEFDVEAFDSDVAVNRVDFLFNDRPWLVFDEVNLLVDGKEVGSLSRSGDYTRSSGSDWRARFSGLNVVIREGETATFTLEVEVASVVRNASTYDIDVDMDVEGVRAVDALGLVQYGDDSGAPTTIAFHDAFGDGSIKVNNNNSPAAGSVFADEGVVLAFSLEAKDADLTIEKVNVDVTDTDSVITSLKLMDGRTTLATLRNPSGSETFDLGRRGLDLRKGRTANLEIVAEFDSNATAGAHAFTVALDGTGAIEATNANFQAVTANSSLSRSYSYIANELLEVSVVDGNVFGDKNDATIEVTLNVTNNTTASITAADLKNATSTYLTYKLSNATMNGGTVTLSLDPDAALAVGDTAELTFSVDKVLLANSGKIGVNFSKIAGQVFQTVTWSQ